MTMTRQIITDSLPAPDSVLERIQKLMRLAARNPSEAEAASAAAKARELLEEWNLDATEVSEARVGGGVREEAALEGGFWEYQQNLWRSVAELNFCLYWHSRVERAGGRTTDRWGDRRRRGYDHRHCLVGRRVNIAATRAMATYLEVVVARLTAERVRGASDLPLYGRWANSYRLGVVSRICRKLRARRSEVLAAEQLRRDAEERASDGASTSSSLTLMVYIDRETDANFDLIYGEGWSQRRAAAALERRRQQEEYARWAADHPEEARAAEEKRRRESRRRGGPGSRGGSGVRERRDRTDRSAYWAGYDAAEYVSIDPQTGRDAPAGLL